jgi:hypothetical protein
MSKNCVYRKLIGFVRLIPGYGDRASPIADLDWQRIWFGFPLPPRLSNSLPLQPHTGQRESAFNAATCPVSGAATSRYFIDGAEAPLWQKLLELIWAQPTRVWQ